MEGMGDGLMYHAIIYSRGQRSLQPSPPVIPATAANEGQTESGTRNSIWRSTKRTEIAKRLIWRITLHEPAQQPNRPANISDVNIEVTSSDGSIWKGKRTTTQTGDPRWEPTGGYGTSAGTAADGRSCSIIGEYGYSAFGLLPPSGGDTRFTEYRCTAQGSVTTYSWEFVSIRKNCNECPPINITQLNDECACGSTVYKLIEEEYSIDVYYWKLESDTTSLTIGASGIIRAVTYEINERAYEDDNGSVSGVLDDDIDDPFIFEIRDGKNHIYSGLIKNWSFKDNQAKFIIVDFRTTLNTDVLLDYSNGESDFRLYKVFEKLTTQINRGSQQFIYEFNYPVDTESTIAIANYAGQYIIVNAQSFLKVYIAYYDYVIDKRYDYTRDILVFTFRKRSEQITEIRLDDFIHDRTRNDIKTNKVVATIKFQTIYEVDTEWIVTDEIAYITAATENKSTLMANELPSLAGYNSDHVLRLAKNTHFKTITQAEYNALPNRLVKSISVTSGPSASGIITYHPTDTPLPEDTYTPIVNPRPPASSNFPPTEGTSCTFDNKKIAYIAVDWSNGRTWIYAVISCEGYVQYACPIDAPSLERINQSFSVQDYEYGSGIRIEYQDSNGNGCGKYTYVMVHSNDVSYYKKGGTIIIPRPSTIATKTYSLGADNNIYEGNAPQSLAIYPIQTKIFENDTLAKAQIDAIYHLVSNRWNENIILNDNDRPLELSKLLLINMIRVYDTNGVFKDLPISEKNSTYKEGNLSRRVKLGFKKELFTQIYKGDTNMGVLK